VIKQGDYLAALAHKFDFDADDVWGHDKNTDLRQARPNPNILNPTDILYIPDQVNKKPKSFSLNTGATNTFVSDAPKTKIAIRFDDEDLKNQAYTVDELPELTDLKTGDDGTASLSIPVTLQSFTIEFTESGAAFTIFVAHLDPIDKLNGIAQRLQNLGYLGPQPDGTDLDVNAVRAGLRLLKADQTDDDSSDSSDDDDSDDDDSDDDDSDDDDSDDDDSDDDDSDDDDSDDDDSDDDDSDDDDSDDDDSDDDDSDDDSDDDDSDDDDSDDDDSDDDDSDDDDDQDGDASDDAGLSDAGKLDAATTKLLLKAHGS
jgi:hypothetical protein